MLNIDTTTMLIELTRGDSASIVFSAKQKDGKTYIPTVGNSLVFAVAKKVGATPLFTVDTALEEVPTDYVEVTITEEEFNLQKDMYYTESGGVYTQCTEADTFDENETYYILDYSEFWTIQITRNKWLDDDGNDKFKFSDYVWDLQLTTETGADTIIGKTSTISPTFRVLGEVAEE